MNNLRGHLVKIQNRETGETKAGNWASLRKSLGIEQYMNADRTEEIFKGMGWEVVSHQNSPGDKIRELARLKDSGVDVQVQTLEAQPETEGQPAVQTVRGVIIEKSESSLITPQVNDDYILRDIDDWMAQILDKISDEYMFLFGEAGSGKTEAVKQYCAIRQIPYTRVSLDESMSLQYLIGRLSFREGHVYYQEGLLIKALQQPGVLFLDEANAMVPSKGFILHQLLDSGCIYIPEADKYYYKHPECRIVLAGNYQSGSYAGVQKMNEAFKNRLSPLELEPMNIGNIKLSGLKVEERRRFVAFFKEVERMLTDKKSKAVITLRNALRYEKFRTNEIGVQPAIRISIIDGIKYTDSGLGEEVAVLALSHFDDLY